MVKHNTTLINSILLLRLLLRDGLYGTEQDSDVSYFSDGIIVDIYVRTEEIQICWGLALRLRSSQILVLELRIIGLISWSFQLGSRSQNTSWSFLDQVMTAFISVKNTLIRDWYSKTVTNGNTIRSYSKQLGRMPVGILQMIVGQGSILCLLLLMLMTKYPNTLSPVMSMSGSGHLQGSELVIWSKSL